MRRSGFTTETDVAKAVVAWLQAEGWECFFEVEYRGWLADIVATRGEKRARRPEARCA